MTVPGGREELARYYATVAPHYDAEMALRDDIPAWMRIVETTNAREVIDLGSGGGRVAAALAPHTRVVGVDLLEELTIPTDVLFARADLRALPFRSAAFDLAIAANDPFAHLVEDADRRRALDEATRVARRVVIDGLAITPADALRARAGGLIREARLPDGTLRHETWIAVGQDRYRTTYRYLREGAVVAEAMTTVRAWNADEPALGGREITLAGALDGTPFTGDAAGFVVAIGGSPWPPG